MTLPLFSYQFNILIYILKNMYIYLLRYTQVIFINIETQQLKEYTQVETLKKKQSQ